ncbi:MAG: hypothetical protein ABH877_00515, partial [bacterium]
ETGDTRRLTHNSAPFEFEESSDASEISRDGKWVAYTWSDSIGMGLGVVDIEGNSPRIVYRGERDSGWIQAVDWSPDGRSILAWSQARGQDELLVISAENGSMRLLKTFDRGDPYEFLFSPDGRFVAYSKNGEDPEENRDIFTVDVATGNEHILVRHPANDHMLGWAPDGRHVLFGSDRSGTQGAWLLPVDDGRANGAPWLVKPDMWHAKGVGFADDGRFFYLVNTGGLAVYTVTFDPASKSVIGSPTAITTPTFGIARKPHWSPDGRHLAYIAEDRLNVVVRSMETGDVKEFDFGEAASVNHTGWSADGRSVFVVVSPERDEYRMAVLRLDVQTGIREERLRAEWNQASSRVYLQISPDERFCFYLLDSEGEVTIVREEIETGDTSQLFRTPRISGLPWWGHLWGLQLSPDGQTLAFTHMGERVVLLPVEGGEPREYPIEDPRNIAWMPEGNALLVGSADEVFYVDLADGQLHPIGLRIQGSWVPPDVHPDGRRIAYASGTQSAELWVMENFLPADASRR